jgi:hypothetical protein
MSRTSVGKLNREQNGLLLSKEVDVTILEEKANTINNISIEVDQQTANKMVAAAAHSKPYSFKMGATFWILLILFVIVIVACFWIAAVSDSQTNWKSWAKVSWANNLWFMGIFMVIALALMFYATFIAAAACERTGAHTTLYWLWGAVAVQSILFVVAFALLFRQKQLLATFWFTIAIAVVTVVQFYLFYCAYRYAGASVASLWLEVVFAIFVIVLIYVTYNIYSNNK